MIFHRTVTRIIQNNKKYTNQDIEKLIKYLELVILKDPYQVRLKRKEFLEKLKKNYINRDLLSKNDDNLLLTAALPWKCTGMNDFIPYLLGVDNYLCSIKPEELSNSDIFCTFGIGKSKGHIAVEEASKQVYRELFRLEYGFLSSKDIAVNGSIQHSIIISSDVMYYDAANESCMERDLNSSDFKLSEKIINRVRDVINSIKKYKVTKYNQAPIKTLDIFKNNKNKKVLLVDQRYGDASIKMGLASQESFKEMWNDALKLKDHDVYIKLHPDAITGGKESCLSKVIPKNLPKNVYLIKEDINPYSVLDYMDKVFVCVSQLGFEALLKNKDVHTYGVSFYSGWGLTKDKISPIRKRRKRNIYELFYIFYIEYSRYFIPEKGIVEIEDIVKYLSRNGIEKNLNNHVSRKNQFVNFLFVIPSGRFGATGRYFQVIAKYLTSIGHNVMVLSEAYDSKIYDGIKWLKLDFDSIRLNSNLMKEINDFSPNIIYENGVRTRAQRAAIEISIITGAKIIIQSEDDDVQVYLNKHPNPSKSLIKVLDKPKLDLSDINYFLKNNDWKFTLKVLANPSFDRWIDPFLRNIINHMAVFNTAIWYPFERRLKQEFGKPTFVVPPVIDITEYNYFEYDRKELKIVFKEYGLNDKNLILFLGGTIYDYSPEFDIFLEALNILSKTIKDYELTLVTVSGRTNINVKEVCEKKLLDIVKHIDLGNPTDDEYLKFLKYSDLICSPGLPDDFNLYRLPSRLVKAMALGKPILTTKIGFGESLIDNQNAILLDTEDPKKWAKSMEIIANLISIKEIGKNGRIFAEDNFDVKKVIDKFLLSLKDCKVI